jgi:hypothetical protein
LSDKVSLRRCRKIYLKDVALLIPVILYSAQWAVIISSFKEPPCAARTTIAGGVIYAAVCDEACAGRAFHVQANDASNFLHSAVKKPKNLTIALRCLKGNT